MSLPIMLGNALWRDSSGCHCPRPKRYCALVVYLLTLIEGGRIRQDGLAKELLTELELLMAGRRQVFSSLEEIESCVWVRL